TVGIQPGRIPAIEFHALLVHDKHRHTGSVFALIENLPGFVVIRIEIYLGLLIERRFAGGNIIAIDTCRIGKRGKSVVEVSVTFLCTEAAYCTNAGQFDFALQLAVEVVLLDRRSGIDEIMGKNFTTS